MIRLTHLRVNGFKQLRDINLSFPARCCVLIEGLNEAGKSTLAEAIYTALYGRGLVMRGGGRGQMDSLIGIGLPEAFVELSLISGDVRLRVERHLYRRRANDARLFIENPDGSTEQVRGVTRVSEEVLTQLNGLDGEALLASCFVQQKKLGQLEEAGRDKRQAVLLKLLDLDRLTQLKDRFAWRARDDLELATARSRQRLAEATRFRTEAECEGQVIEKQLRLVEIHTELDEADRLETLAKQSREHMQEQARLRNQLDVQVSCIQTLDRAVELLDRILESRTAMHERAKDVRVIDRELSELDRIGRDVLPARQAERANLAALAERLARLGELESRQNDYQARLKRLRALVAEAETVEKPKQELAGLRRELEKAQRYHNQSKNLLSLGQQVERLVSQIKELERDVDSEAAREARLIELTRQVEALATPKEELIRLERLITEAKTRVYEVAGHHRRAQEIHALRSWIAASRELGARHRSDEIIKEHEDKAATARKRELTARKRATDATLLLGGSTILLILGLAILFTRIHPALTIFGALSASLGPALALLGWVKRMRALAICDAAVNEQVEHEGLARDERIRQQILLSKEVPDLAGCQARLEALEVAEPQSVETAEALAEQMEKELPQGWTVEGLGEALEQTREEVRQLEIQATRVQEQINAQERQISAELLREEISDPNDMPRVIDEIKARGVELQNRIDELKGQVDELGFSLPEGWSVAELRKEEERAEQATHDLDIQIARLAEQVRSGEQAIAQAIADEDLVDLDTAQVLIVELDESLGALSEQIELAWKSELDALNLYTLPNNAIAAQREIEKRLIALNQEVTNLQQRLRERETRQAERKRLVEEIESQEQRIATRHEELRRIAAIAELSVGSLNSETESELLKTVRTERARYDLSQIKAEREQAASAASRAEADATRAEQERRSRLDRAGQLLLELGAEAQRDLDRQAVTEMFPEFGTLTASDRERLEKQRIDTVAQLRSLSNEVQRLEAELRVGGVTLDEAACVAEVERLQFRKAICQRATPIVERVRDNILQAILPSTLDYMRAMLPLLTAGRYHDAELDEETYKIRVWDAQAREYVEKDIYSGATQDQFSLALRLGFALAALPQERGARPGFIFLDEPTAGFDAQRRRALVELLTRGELAERFDQIFLFAPDGAFPENPFPHYVRLVEGRMVAENLSQRIEA